MRDGDNLMSKTRIVQTDIFEAKSKTGRIYVIAEQTIQVMRTLEDESNTGWMDGAKYYLVKSGGTAKKLSVTEFHLIASGENATRM